MAPSFASNNPSRFMDHQETLSFVIFLDLSEQARCIYATDSVNDLLGYTPDDLQGTSFLDLVHPDELAPFSNLHYEHIKNDIAASLTFLRLRPKEGDNYALCAFSRSVAYNFIVGSISLARPDPGNARAATATGGVFVLTPAAEHRSFRRWNTRVDLAREIYTGSPNDWSVPINELPRPSKREALIVDRFKKTIEVLHCSNDCIVHGERVFQKDLLQFIPSDDDRLALVSAVDMVKTWGAQFEGSGDGIFTFCRFTLEVPTNPRQLKDLDAIVSTTSDATLLTLVLRQ